VELAVQGCRVAAAIMRSPNSKLQKSIVVLSEAKDLWDFAIS
jgi:hypothetical protein